MPLYLKADCVFSFFINENVFTDKNWKNINKETSKYYVDFESHNNGSIKICSFEVSVIKNTHCILAEQLLHIVGRFKIYDKAEKLFDDCAFVE